MLLSETVPFKVFVSRASVDKNHERVQHTIELLLQYQVNIYIAENDYQCGGKLTAKVKSNLSTSTVVIAFLTSNGVKSAWVQQEIGFAKALNKPVFILYDDTKVKETGEYFGMCFDEEGCKLSDAEGMSNLLVRIIKSNPKYEK